MKRNSIKIFCSYSHKDEELKNELESHLAVLKRIGLIEVWTDRRILPGSYWESQINENLESADIILLLISSDFMSSNYCFDVEIRKAIEQHEKRISITIPIILRECDWEDAPFSNIQGLPTDMQPIISKNWFSKDEAYKNVSTNLKTTIRELLNTKENKQQIEYEDLPKTVKALRNFISKYNDGKYVQLAKNKLIELDEEDCWLEATKQSSLKNYKDYMAQYPNGKYISQAKIKIDEAEFNEKQRKPDDNVDEILSSLFSSHIQTQIKNKLVHISKLKAVDEINSNLSFLFVGGPGTGKTHTARIFSKLLKAYGLLSKGHMIEVSRSDLVSGFMGQTALKVKELINKAIGGVLVIDEAYNLSMGSSDMFGQEAINEIILGMENHGSEICFIFSGYKNEIDKLMALNPGFNRRINAVISFDENKPQEYLNSFVAGLKQENFNYTNEFLSEIEKLIWLKMEKDKTNFGGFRFVNQMLSETILNFILRCEQDESDQNLEKITIFDIPGHYRNNSS